jgi:hypothetical protein
MVINRTHLCALFQISKNLTYVGRPYIWVPDFAWFYGFASPNDHGDIAIEEIYGGGKMDLIG